MSAADPLTFVGLTHLMQVTSGLPDVIVGLIDGPVATHLPAFADATLRDLSAGDATSCSDRSDLACTHGTFVAALLASRRDSGAPGICGGCTLLIRPIFVTNRNSADDPVAATPEELARAICECVDAGVRVINLSVSLDEPSGLPEPALESALDYASARGVIVVAAAGNQGSLGSSPVTRHRGVIPVTACDLQGRPQREANLAPSIARRGLRAPGHEIPSLTVDGKVESFSGTSAATPFVSGTIALLWSVFTAATAAEIQAAVLQSARGTRRTIVPPVLDAWRAYETLAATNV